VLPSYEAKRKNGRTEGMGRRSSAVATGQGSAVDDDVLRKTGPDQGALAEGGKVRPWRGERVLARCTSFFQKLGRKG